MSSSKLDQIVKGAPSPDVSIPSVSSRSPSPASISSNTEAGTSRSTTPLTPSDPLAALPSSPPQIYLNLLILEASLRSQYLTLRARRRQHTFFLLLLTVWNTWFLYALFLRPREDGSGVGGSVYWVVEMAEKVALMGGIVTGILIWGTGQWDRGVKWPRRWVAIANRGLRNINAKIVVIKGPWWRETLGLLSFLFPYSSFFPNSTPTGSHEEDLSPGGDFIKLLLLPKPFSADFRENWELYRIEYWEKENERRAHLRQQLRTRQKTHNRSPSQSSWRQWIPPWRKRPLKHPGAAISSDRDRDPERPLSRSKHHAHAPHTHEAPPSKPRRRSLSRSSGPSQSRTPSRSSTTPSLEAPDDARPSTGTHHPRRGSSNASGSERRRKTRSMLANEGAQITRLTPRESRSSVKAGSGGEGGGGSGSGGRGGEGGVGSGGSGASVA